MGRSVAFLRAFTRLTTLEGVSSAAISFMQIEFAPASAILFAYST